MVGATRIPALRCIWRGTLWDAQTAQQRCRSLQDPSLHPRGVEVYRQDTDYGPDADRQIGLTRILPLTDRHMNVIKLNPRSDEYGVEFEGVPAIVIETIDGVIVNPDPRWAT